MRITSILAGLVAAALLAFFSAVGVKGDPAVEDMVRTRTVIEQIKERPATSPRASRTSVLDGLARDFVRVINPPPENKAAGATSDPATRTPPKPPRPSAKFKLLATSYHPSDPSLSLALIDLSTAETRQFWVRVGQSIDHYKVTEIRDGSLLYGDGRQTQQIDVEERPARISLLDTGKPARPATGPVSPIAGQVPARASGSPAVSARPSPLGGRRPLDRASLADPRAIQAESDAVIREMTDKLRTKDASEGSLTPEQQQQIRQEAMEKLVSYVQAARMSQQEANSLGDLGRQLDEVPTQDEVQPQDGVDANIP
ncbi:MAG: hypothetical protein KBE04_01930 [Phycisphaerae bacterium]|nr:hypothetical protein [Phycisphaerae bacterium]